MSGETITRHAVVRYGDDHQDLGVLYRYRCRRFQTDGMLVVWGLADGAHRNVDPVQRRNGRLWHAEHDTPTPVVRRLSPRVVEDPIADACALMGWPELVACDRGVAPDRPERHREGCGAHPRKP